MTERFYRMRWILAVLLAAAALPRFSSGNAAEGETYRKPAGTYTVYLTVVPAEMIRGPGAEQPAGAPPQRAPAARDTHHVMVSIFDTHSGLRMSDMEVRARVAALGFSGEKQDLPPIRLGDGIAYANSFPMLGRGPFRIDVEFRAHIGQRLRQATFYFTHPSFAGPAS